METNQSTSNESIRKEQLLLLYESLIDDGCHLYNAYKRIHNKLISHENKNIVQDIMKTKLYQCRELIDLYNQLSRDNYANKKVDIEKECKLSKMFAKESNYAETLNYIYSNTNEISIKLNLTKVINDENAILFKLLYLQSLIGVYWEANNK